MSRSRRIILLAVSHLATFLIGGILGELGIASIRLSKTSATAEAAYSAELARLSLREGNPSHAREALNSHLGTLEELHGSLPESVYLADKLRSLISLAQLEDAAGSAAKGAEYFQRASEVCRLRGMKTCSVSELRSAASRYEFAR